MKNIKISSTIQTKARVLTDRHKDEALRMKKNIEGNCNVENNKGKIIIKENSGLSHDYMHIVCMHMNSYLSGNALSIAIIKVIGLTDLFVCFMKFYESYKSFVIFSHISLLNIHPSSMLSLSFLSLSPLLMASGCLQFIYLTLTMSLSDVPLCVVVKVGILARTHGCYLEGIQHLCRICKGFILYYSIKRLE